MPNEPSFFERLTGASRSNDSTPTKRVDFKQKKKRASEDDGSEAQSETNIIEENMPEPSFPDSEKPSSDSASAEKKDQWLEEAQEGQLTIDVYQTDTDIVIKSTMAGVEANDPNLDISITNDMVTIRGRRERDEDIPASSYFYQECYWGPFSRSIILPTDIDSEKAEATMHSGILTIRLPKIEKEQTKKIKVKPIS